MPKYDEIDLFIDYFTEKYGLYPMQMDDKRIIAEEVASFVHNIERKLIDRYDLDCEYKETTNEESTT